MFGVEPELLRNASKEFGNGSDAVREAAEMISMLKLDAGALGEVDAATEFADALSKFVGTHAQDLQRGSAWITDAVVSALPASSLTGYSAGKVAVVGR